MANAKLARKENDLYETNTALTHCLLHQQDLAYGYPKKTCTISEPAAGKGAISNILKDQGYNVVTNDLFEEGHDYHLDATQKENAETLYKYDWTITNPPFNNLLPILENALEYSHLGVALLLRLSFLEPTKSRADVLKNYPPTKAIILCNPRPKYRIDTSGNDSVTTAWFVWEFNHEDYDMKKTQLIFDTEWKTRNYVL